MLGIDYSFAKISAASIKDNGFGFVCRYLGSSTGKRLGTAECQALQAEGLPIVLVFEDYANQSLNGRGQGIADAQEALSQANGLGLPPNRPIYFAVDFDASEAQQAAIDDYLRGAASVIGADRVGIYGGYYVVKRCLDNGTAAWAWQTVAWSGGQVDPRVHIYQNGQSAFNGGADINESRKSDFGQWGGTITPEDFMTKEQAAELALYIRLLAFESVDEANSHADDDVRHIMADPAYAAAIAKAVYSGEWQVPAWKAGHYDDVAKQLADATNKPPAPVPDPVPTPTPAPTPSTGNWLADLINSIIAAIRGKK